MKRVSRPGVLCPAIPPALVSIHDVMPETLDRVEGILGLLETAGIRPVTLLVVCGRPWRTWQVEALRTWQAAGHVLAGHGWRHVCDGFSGPWHRLHGRVMSRNEAEHLELSRPALRRLVSDCHAWFTARGLGSPSVYVPPAWAMGRLSRADLARLPFRYYETLTGVFDARLGRFHALPVTAYLAARGGDAPFLRAFNALNRAAVRTLDRPWRVAIHPPDPWLGLGPDLWQDVGSITWAEGYENALG